MVFLLLGLDASIGAIGVYRLVSLLLNIAKLLDSKLAIKFFLIFIKGLRSIVMHPIAGFIFEALKLQDIFS